MFELLFEYVWNHAMAELDCHVFHCVVTAIRVPPSMKSGAMVLRLQMWRVLFNYAHKICVQTGKYDDQSDNYDFNDFIYTYIHLIENRLVSIFDTPYHHRILLPRVL